MRQTYKSVAAITLFLLAAPFANAHDSYQGHAKQPTLDVTATGTIKVIPDLVIIRAGVSSEAKVANDAMVANAALISSVFQELKNAGIASTDINTSQLTLSPKYSYNDKRSPKVTGYQAQNNLTIRTKNLGAVGVTLDALVRSGINNIDTVQFTLEDSSQAEKDARGQAIDNAVSKAKFMADRAGIRLGKMVSFTENGSRSYDTDEIIVTASRKSSSPAITQVSAGERNISVTVNMSYLLE